MSVNHRARTYVGETYRLAGRCGALAVALRDRSDVEAELGRLEAAVSVASSRADPATLVSILRGATTQVKALSGPKEKP